VPAAGRRRRSPQERKALDYAKQRRNTYNYGCVSLQSARKRIRQGKARGRRLERRGVAEELRRGEDADVEPVAQRLASRHFRKYPDTPLGEVIEFKLAFRERVRDEPVVRAEARARRRTRRSRQSR